MKSSNKFWNEHSICCELPTRKLIIKYDKVEMHEKCPLWIISYFPIIQPVSSAIPFPPRGSRDVDVVEFKVEISIIEEEFDEQSRHQVIVLLAFCKHFILLEIINFCNLTFYLIYWKRVVENYHVSVINYRNSLGTAHDKMQVKIILFVYIQRWIYNLKKWKSILTKSFSKMLWGDIRQRSAEVDEIGIHLVTRKCIWNSKYWKAR